MHGSGGSATQVGQQAPTSVSLCVPASQVMSAQGSQPVSVHVGQQALGSWTIFLHEAGSDGQVTLAHDSVPVVLSESISPPSGAHEPRLLRNVVGDLFFGSSTTPQRRRGGTETGWFLASAPPETGKAPASAAGAAAVAAAEAAPTAAAASASAAESAAAPVAAAVADSESIAADGFADPGIPRGG